MLLLFSLDCRRNQAAQVVLGTSGAQCVAQRNLGIAEQAHLQVTIGRDAQSVATAAKVFRHRADEAQLTSEARHLERFGGVVWTVVEGRTIRVALVNGGQSLTKWYHRASVPPIPSEWHVLYESNVYATIPGHLDKVAQLVIVETLQQTKGVGSSKKQCYTPTIPLLTLH